MLQEVLGVIKTEDLMRAGELVVAGVSGGADSICLLSVLSELREQLGIRLAAVHVHHGIRGEEAERDAEYVRLFCREREIPCRVFYRDVPAAAKEKGLSLEEAGRLIRYECFAEALKEWNGDRMAVAHNRNDNAETVLFHLFRGSGFKGLAGVAVKGPMPGDDGGGREVLVRPLLFVSRREIEGYLETKQIAYCQDSTNMSEDYSRNRIRRQILPQAELVNQEAVLHIVQAAGMIGELDKWMTNIAREWIQKYCRHDLDMGRAGNGVYIRIPSAELKGLEPVQAGYVLRQVMESLAGSLKDITKRHTDSILELLEKQSGRYVHLPGGFTAEKRYDELWIGRRSKQETAGENEDGPERSSGRGFFLRPAEKEQFCELFGFYVHYWKFPREGDEKIPENRYTKWFDYDKIRDSLCLRGRCPGDYFQAFPDGGRQTVKAYMINEKIPSGKRGRIPILADGSHVLWIIGGRISEAYKVTEETKQILVVTVRKNRKEMD